MIDKRNQIIAFRPNAILYGRCDFQTKVTINSLEGNAKHKRTLFVIEIKSADSFRLFR